MVYVASPVELACCVHLVVPKSPIRQTHAEHEAFGIHPWRATKFRRKLNMTSYVRIYSVPVPNVVDSCFVLKDSKRSTK